MYPPQGDPLEYPKGLAYYGDVSSVPGANQFACANLAGYGDTCFVGWEVWVQHDAGGAGAAPQTEHKAVTAYTSATGAFTTAAFTAAVGVGDKILLLHPRIQQVESAVPTTELLTYSPSLQDSGDMEAATTTITATSKGAVPDYAANLTVPAPSDSRIEVVRMGVRITLTVDSMTATTLSGEVWMNGAKIKDLTAILAAGAKVDAVDLTTFNIGSANAYQVFLWVDAGDAVISLCQIQQAIGSTTQSYSFYHVLRVNHKGRIQWMLETNLTGTGTAELRIGPVDACRPSCFQSAVAVNSVVTPAMQLCYNNGIGLRAATYGLLISFSTTMKMILRN